MIYAKRIFVIAICICSFQLLSAQTNYISYTIKSGETLSLLAKRYNTTVGDIMRLNGMHTNSKIEAGEKIKIPSKTSVTTAKKEAINAPENTSSVNVTANKSSANVPSNSFVHTVTKGESLYSIAKKYSVTVKDLKTWNHLTSDNTRAGSTLIIAHNTKSVESTTTAQTTPQPVQKQRVETTTAQQTKQDDIKQDSVKQDNTPQNNTITQYQDTATENNSFATAMAPQVNAQLQVAQDKTATEQSLSSNYSGSGYFAAQFNEKNKSLQTVSGVSKTFKTASGWADGKYYILANNIEPGTIVKIAADNGNAVYAKVLWNLGDMKDNTGINFRVSNATAAALHEDNTSFNVNISF